MEVNDAWKKFNGIIQEIIENISKHKRTNKRRPCIAREVKKREGQKTKSWKKYHKLKEETKNELSGENENLKRNCANKKNTCNDTNRTAIKSFEQKLSRNIKEDSKSFYNYVRSKQKRKERVWSLKRDDGNEESYCG